MKRLVICGLVSALALPVAGLWAAEGNPTSGDSKVVSSEAGSQGDVGVKAKKKSRRQGKRKGPAKAKKSGLEKKDAEQVGTPSVVK